MAEWVGGTGRVLDQTAPKTLLLVTVPSLIIYFFLKFILLLQASQSLPGLVIYRQLTYLSQHNTNTLGRVDGSADVVLRRYMSS